MALGLNIFGIASAAGVDVDATPKAVRGILYDFAGNLIIPANRSAVAETAGGVMNAGKDYKVSRTLRASSIGTLRTTDNALFLYDAFEGTARDSNKWVETAATMTSAQAIATGLTLNSGSSVTNAQGILESSHRQFPLIPRTGLHLRMHARVVGATACIEEFGFSDQTSATTAVHNNGAFFRRDSAGSLQPVLAFNGTETQGTVMTGPATTEYAWYEIFLEDSRATFQVFSATGALLSSQVMEIGSSGGGAGSATQARMSATTHLPAMMRVYNNGTAGTAPQIIVNQAVVQVVDMDASRPVQVQQSGMGYNSLVSPTAYTQLANWGNSAAPTTRTLSNTAAAETTLGGLLRVNSIAGGNTDLIMFGWQNPSPYTFYCDSIYIPTPLNEVVAVATTATIFAYFASFNLSAVSLATGGTYPGHRVALPGIHTAAVALAANALFSGNGIQVTFPTPIAVQPGRFLHIGCRELVGTATATETYLWAGVAVGGFFE